MKSRACADGPNVSSAATKPMIMREKVVIIASSIVSGSVSEHSALQHRGVEAWNRERASSLSRQVNNKTRGEADALTRGERTPKREAGASVPADPRRGSDAGSVRAFSFFV